MSEERPLLPQLPSEFLTWVWWATEEQGGRLNLGEELGWVEIWVDDRIAFRTMSDEKPRAVITSENASSAVESRAALAGGRVVKELRLAMKRDDREYSFTLKGEYLDIVGAKLPGVVKGGATDELLYDRMYLYEELQMVVAGLLTRFAGERVAPAWKEQQLPEMRAWVAAALQVDTAEGGA